MSPLSNVLDPSAGPSMDKATTSSPDESTSAFSLRWNNFELNMTSVFHQLLQSEAFVDVSLACGDQILRAHKVRNAFYLWFYFFLYAYTSKITIFVFHQIVLSSCSPYFRQIFLDNPCKHPTIIMPEELQYCDLQAIVEFMYCGEVEVTESSLKVSTFTKK